MKNTVFISCLLLVNFCVEAQITIDIHPNFRHEVGGIDSFDRIKMLKIHADQPEPDWEFGNNFGDFGDLRDSFLNTNDVNMGRNTGVISWYVNQVNEDPGRPGFADTTHLAQLGKMERDNYAKQTSWRAYEKRNELVVAAQQKPFFPDGTKTGKGWSFANGTATGEFMGRFINEFHGANGQPKPKYLEIMNEPLYKFVTVGNHSPLEIFEFHNEAADAIRKQVSDIPIGGYCAAFPNFEVDNFQRWNDRWKLFMDTSGDKMDFWSIHFYDFNLDFNNKKILRRGSNLEATFEMIDHYSMLSFDTLKPYVISEYGGRALSMESEPWSPFRDWQTVKSWTSMLLTFSERPHLILSAIPFVIVKATWGTQANGNPYPWRLMRMEREAEGEEGFDWVYTDMVKFFELWKEVRGTRINARSTNPDIQTNAFVDKNRMYVILNNLNFNREIIHLNLVEKYGNDVNKIRVKHMYFDEALDQVFIQDSAFDRLDSIEIEEEGSIILEYHFSEEVLIDENVKEEKFFADDYLKPIVPLSANEYNVNGVKIGEKGEAVLRLGMGRPHGRSLQPTVKFNGFDLQVPSNYMGYDQSPRNSWFGLIEIPVPFSYLREDNNIKITYPDEGGHISTLALRLYHHSDDMFRSDYVPVNSLTLIPSKRYMLPETMFQMVTDVRPLNATDPALSWESSDTSIALIDEYGTVTSRNFGSCVITVTSNSSGIQATSIIEVVDSLPFIPAYAIANTPKVLTVKPSEFFQIEAVVLPTDATNQTVSWFSGDENVVIVDSFGLVKGVLEGKTEVISIAEDGGFTDTSSVEVVADFATNIFCSLLPKSLEIDSTINFEFSYSTGYESVVIVELTDKEGKIVGRDEVNGFPGFNNQAEISMILDSLPASGDFYNLQAKIISSIVDTVLFQCEVEGVELIRSTSSSPAEIETRMNVFPNPSTGMLNIEDLSDEKIGTITLIDVSGRILYLHQTDLSKIELDLKDYSSGIYYLHIENERKKTAMKIIRIDE